MLHVSLEFLRVSVHPRVLDVGDPMKSHHRDLAVDCLGYRLLELLERALRFAVEGLRHEEWVIPDWIVSPRSPGTGKAVASDTQNAYGSVTCLVSRIAKADRFGYSVFFALLLDILDIGIHLLGCLSGHRQVPASVVTDLKAVRMELLDLFPSHVILLVLGKVEAFGDEEGRSKAILLKQWSNIGSLTGD